MFAAQSMPAPSLSALASGASWPLSWSNGSAPGGDEGDEDVERGGDQQRADDRARQVALGLLDLLAGGRDRVEADVGEEDQRRRGHRPLDALALDEERREVVAVERGDAEHQEQQQHGELEEHHDRVRARGLAHADHQHAGDREHEERRGDVDLAALLAGRVGDRVRQRQPEQRVQQLVEVGAPSDGHGRDRDAVLEDQVPADDPGRELAERRVGVGVGAARDRDGRRELGEGQRREDAGDARDHEGQDDRRARRS